MLVHRLVFALLLAGALGTLAAPACSSSSTNPEGEGEGDAAPAPTCVDAGDDCNACCADAVGSLPETAYKLSARACVCEDAPLVCQVPCAELCTNDFITGGCVLCLQTLGAPCMINRCAQDDCKAYQSCVKTCK